MAWLQAAPDHKEKDRKRQSRAKEFESFGVPFDPPPEPEHGGLFLEWFKLSGMALSGMSGPIPLTWSEIESFSRSSNLQLTGWEKSLMRRLSEVYCASLSAFRDPKAPPPYYPEDGLLATFKAGQRQ